MKKGFTLIELMIIVAIFGILAAVAIPKICGLSSKKYEYIIVHEGQTEVFDSCYEIDNGVHCENAEGEKMIHGTYTMKKVRK